MRKRNQGRWSARSPFLWFCLLLAIIAGPVGFAAHDWAEAVRRARNAASLAAMNEAARGFLNQRYHRRTGRRLTITLVEAPPRTGAYAGYVYATHVETLYEWRPVFQALLGGPHLIRGEATAAVLRDKDGHWMPVLVE